MRNEADRYLRRALANAASFCDELVVLDDRSTDDTVAVCEECPIATVHRLEGEGQFWGVDESGPRALLWRLAASAAGADGWVYIFDADHELLCHPEAVQTLCTAQHVVAWAFPLYDCWDSDRTMRVDGYWRAHLTPRVWLARAVPIPEFTPVWDTRAIHSGHLPHNFPLHLGVGTTPTLAGICHLGYVRVEDRIAKHAKYMEASLTEAEHAHAASIIEPAELAPIPQVAVPKVLVASIVRKPAVVVDAFLQTLAWQQVKADLKYAFILNYAEGEAEQPAIQQLFADFMKDRTVKLARADAPVGDYGDTDRTRSWSNPAFDRVAQLKDQLIEEAIREGFDYLWLVDADVLNDPYALQSFLNSDAPIVAGVYWTQWTRHQPGDALIQHAGPQVWLTGTYGLSGQGYTEAEFRRALIDRERLQVWGLGANTLFKTDVLKKGIRFSRWTQLQPGPMSEGEDRQLCARATALHIPLIADAWPDIYHAYHPAEYDQIPAVLEQFKATPHGTPQIGWLTSIRLKNLEVANAPPVHIRGRYGLLPVLPQIEEALASMEPGQSRLLRVTFPLSWPEDALRNRTFVIEVTLCDARPYRLPPVIDKELFVGNASGSYYDQTTLTVEQCNVLAGSPS